MASPLQILKSYGFEPRRQRGQNFLIDQNIVRKIIAKAEIKKTDTVVEIGAGVGVLTQELAHKAKKVFAVEIDRKLVEILQNEIVAPMMSNQIVVQSQETGASATGNIEIIRADVRTLPNKTFGIKDFSYRVIANIPYNLTSFLIRKFLEESPRPSDLILLIQKEVGERLCAKPRQMSILSAIAQYYSAPMILFPVAKTCFFPRPKVDSVCISLILRKERIPASPEAKTFVKLVKAGFSAKRKLLIRNLSKAFMIPHEDMKEYFTKSGILHTARAQELSVKDWELFCHYINDIVRV